MSYVRAKKNLGQHFLKDKNIAQKIVESLGHESTNNVLEIGPGTGVLTQFLLKNPNINLKVVEIDHESVEYLAEFYPQLSQHIVEADFLKTDLQAFYKEPFSIIGNFPYNISSQIFFKILANKSSIPVVVGMVQKEVAERICADYGSKTYGILSVLLQAYYDLEYLFTVNENVFIPPPKVKSAVIRLTRKEQTTIDCDEGLFVKVVENSFLTNAEKCSGTHLKQSLRLCLKNLPCCALSN